MGVENNFIKATNLNAYYSTNVLLIKRESGSSFIKQRAIIPVKVTGNKDIRQLGTWARSLQPGSLIPDFAPHAVISDGGYKILILFVAGIGDPALCTTCRHQRWGIEHQCSLEG